MGGDGYWRHHGRSASCQKDHGDCVSGGTRPGSVCISNGESRGEWTIEDLMSPRQLLVHGALCVCVFEHER